MPRTRSSNALEWKVTIPMPDQATELRQLVLRGARTHLSLSAAPPKLVAIASGKGGVGATTLAVNLAIALAGDGRRTVLVDVDLAGADCGTLCGLGQSYTVADVLSGQRTLHEALELGPAGIQLLAGAWGRRNRIDATPAALDRLLVQIQQLGAHADYVLLDLGRGANRVASQFWHAADVAVFVTTPDVLSIMDTYATVKLLATEEQPAIASVVNQVADADAARHVHERLARACRRFLGVSVESLGHVPTDDRVSLAAARHEPFMLHDASCAAARNIELLAQSLVVAAHRGKLPGSRGHAGGTTTQRVRAA